jgi:hypothetical protein
MNYKQAMIWSRRHPKGTKQPVLMSTDSGFWPSLGTIENYGDYTEACRTLGTKPLPIEQHYKLNCRGGALSLMTHEEAAEWTKEQADSDYAS